MVSLTRVSFCVGHPLCPVFSLFREVVVSQDPAWFGGIGILYSDGFLASRAFFWKLQPGATFPNISS